MESIGYRNIWSTTWPIILANCTVPLLGLADTAIIGNTGSEIDLGAVALGGLIFNFLYWSFGFLRMGTTGFSAQADGIGDNAEVRAILARALLIAIFLGFILILLQWPLAEISLYLLSASPAVEDATREYLHIRIWAAPATLSMYAIMGLMIGLGCSHHLLRIQLVLNGLNILLDILFAGVFKWGVAGIATGTACAEWLSLIYAGYLTYSVLSSKMKQEEHFWDFNLILNTTKFRKMISVNFNIMIRTLFLLFGFAWFTNQSAQFGNVVLAGNHILLQFVSFSAFFLDGFAFTAEVLVGRAAGASRQDLFDIAVSTSSKLAVFTAITLSIIFFLLGPKIILALTDLPEVRNSAQHFLPYAAVYVLVSVAAFQLDGIFIGTIKIREMRNASVISTAVFLAVSYPLIMNYKNDGLWIAFIIFVIFRALTLSIFYPKLRHEITRTKSS